MQDQCVMVIIWSNRSWNLIGVDGFIQRRRIDPLTMHEEIFRCSFHHQGLDEWTVPLQSRIELFDVHKHVHQTVPEICV
jgi:hypothetical protein